MLVGASGPHAAETAGERLSLGISRASEGVDRSLLELRNLGDDMRGRAKAVDAERLGIARHAQRAMADQPRTQQRRRGRIRVALGQRKAIGSLRDCVVGIAAIDLVPREERRIAKVLLLGPAKETAAAGMPQPRNADAIATRKLEYAGPDRFDAADDLMAGYDRQARLGQVAVDHVQVGSTNATGCDLYEDLARTRHGIGNIPPLEKLPRGLQDHCFHPQHSRSGRIGPNSPLSPAEDGLCARPRRRVGVPRQSQVHGTSAAWSCCRPAPTP